ncbi:MAG: 1-acyl-sn-glycerol-3-phosphate acyltransferase [Clostridium sp.]|nr:1-acyl-sn-glycerol-3-phosphate acyltransferase [Clostridium sp.]
MRTICISILVVFYTFFTWPLRIHNRSKAKEEREAANYKLLRRLIKWVTYIGKMDINVTGMENINSNNSYLIIGNHKSDIDSLLLIWLFEKPIIFIGKEEVKKVPFISTWFKEIGCLFMDRDDIRQSAKVILEGVQVLKGGKSLVIFPEGKRIFEDGLGMFKPGSFKLAMKSDRNVLPIAIDGAYKVFEEHKTIKPGKIKINIGKEICWKDMGLKNTNEICEHTKLTIEQLLNS